MEESPLKSESKHELFVFGILELVSTNGNICRCTSDTTVNDCIIITLKLVASPENRKREKRNSWSEREVRTNVRGWPTLLDKVSFSSGNRGPNLAKDKHPVSDIVNARLPDDVDKRNKLLSLFSNVVFARSGWFPSSLSSDSFSSRWSIDYFCSGLPSCLAQKGYDRPYSIEKRSRKNIRGEHPLSN